MRYADKQSLIEIMAGISKKIPQGIMNGYDVVGNIEWQMYLMRDYLKLDGTQLADASTDYAELLKFAQDNELITSDLTEDSLFKYDSGTDVLTLPDYDTNKTTDLIPQIKYRKTTTMWETVEIGKFVATAPSHYERQQIFSTNKTTITIYPTWVNIDNNGYVLETAKTINIENADNWDDNQYVTAANRAGKDFYIYACKPVSEDEPIFVLSDSSTVPVGYTVDNSRKIGGFHCLCLSVGTISGHTLSGYVTGDILPQSPWDLIHRAVSENDGMVWIPERNLWVDIYLNSWDGAKLVSVFGGVTADGESTPKFHGEKFVEALGLVNKKLPARDDFVVFAKGSNEGTNILGSADPNTTGGHVDTNNRRMISNYGLEDCCGALWQWSQDCMEFYPGATWGTNDYWLSGYAWQTKPVYNPNCDTQSYGSCFGLLRRLLLGGSWGASAYCGSRCVPAFNFGTCLNADFGSRGCATNRIS